MNAAQVTTNLDSVTYRIIDGHTGCQVGKDYAGKDRKRARNRAEKLNQAYGAHRYSAQPVFAR